MITLFLKRWSGLLMIALLALALSTFVILNPGGDETEIDSNLVITHNQLPGDFALTYEWGACSTESPRQLLTINRAGTLYLLLVDSVGTTGRESTRSLSLVEQGKLLDVLRSNQVFDLPDQILPEAGRTTLTPGCSHLEITFDGRSKTIDEADGLDNRYYRIKLILSALTSGSVV